MSALKRRLRNLRALTGAPLAFRPGHFYSPVCDPAEVARRFRDPETKPPPGPPGIDLNAAAQRARWQRWQEDEAAIAAYLGHGRYRTTAPSYGPGDAFVYAAMLREMRPRRLIEVGCGASSALALDTFDHWGGDWPAITFIEPYPALLHRLLRPGDAERVRIIAAPVQDVELALFDTLATGDMLFIDSTHVVKTGSDVLHEVFDILPRLAPGVVVHFHDVFYPFEYPREWVIERNYSWNELYLLRAFLTGNPVWEILFFTDFFAKTAPEDAARVADFARNPGGALWLRRAA